MNKILVICASFMVFAIGCSQATTDLEGIDGKDPSQIEIYRSPDGFPNLGRMCIDGVAFVISTREYNSYERVPAWDAWCGGKS